MKKAFLYTYLFLFGLLLAGCSSDDAPFDSLQDEGKAHVTLRIGVDNGDIVTRSWTDGNAKTDRTEMMYSWCVVLTDADNKVVFKQSKASVEEANAEIDVVVENLVLDAGTYTAYNFANIAESNLPAAITSATVGQTLTSEAIASITDAVVTVNGNGFVPSATQGIPMSNKQTLTIAASDTQGDLVVVRMLAKMTVSVKNETGTEQYIKYATITGITDNVANNLMLLPNYTDAGNANTMDAVHGDIRPNLNGTPATTELAIPGMATTEALANDATREVTFYVNECATGTDFYLTIGLGDASSTQEYRYALIDNKGKTTDDDDMWDYIARNDYRVIPIILDDFHFQIIPYDFPPIGVFPVSVSEVDTENHIYNFTFHDYGHFHLLPLVTKGTSTQVKFNVGSGDYWTLQPATTSPDVSAWENSFFTATTKGGAWLSNEQVEAAGFYRATGDIVKDDDNAGRAPVWYPNNDSSVPQWDPNLTPGADPNYEPFIFGYIADPEEAMTADKKIYHEMKIRLYVGGSYRRDMTYRFYMTLSQEQMLYAPLHHAGFQHCPHSH